MLWRGTPTQRCRLVSGLILFTFAATHFLNHALGLISIDAMTAMQEGRKAITRSIPGGVILGGALLTHMSLGISKLVYRSTLRMPLWEAVQIGLGLLIPILLFPHIVNTRVAHEVLGVNDIYTYELVRLWPARAVDQTVLLALVWAHGCIGLHFWLRLVGWYRKAEPFALALAVLVPFAGIAGFVVAGRQAREKIADEAFFSSLKQVSNWPEGDAAANLTAWADAARFAGIWLIAAIAIGIILRIAYNRFGPRVRVQYTGGPGAVAPVGPTLLEISRMNRVPHASVCGGRARCSTCRVKVAEGIENLPPASTAEALTLSRVNTPPDVRLACQIRPHGDLTVTRLVGTALTAEGLQDPNAVEAQGVEATAAILFLDLRGFTKFSETMLPYDIVHLLNRFFERAGDAVLSNNGRIDKYTGDGLMAVFGHSDGPHMGCIQALKASRQIDLGLKDLNTQLGTEIDQPLRVGMGLDAGDLVMGKIGHANSAAMTVIGNSVNTASRLEAMTKELGCQLIMSSAVARYAGLGTDRFVKEVAEIRGLSDPIDIICIHRARNLPVGDV